MDAAFDGPRHDLGVAVIARRVRQQRRDQQGSIHDQAVHGEVLQNRYDEARCSEPMPDFAGIAAARQ
jgi:hypothetical protein